MTFALIAGPCAVESRDQMLTTAIAVADAGATMLRGGAFKPRTSPHSFQGLGRDGLALLAEAADATGLPVVTELTDVRELDAVLEVADTIQVGARNMQNHVLRELGPPARRSCSGAGRRRRSTSCCWPRSTLAEGNEAVTLCERGSGPSSALGHARPRRSRCSRSTPTCR